MGEKVGEKWSSRQSNLPETRFPYLYDKKVVLDTSQDPPGLTLWPCPSPKAFMDFIKMPGMLSLGQGSASDIGKGMEVALCLPVFLNFLLQIGGDWAGGGSGGLGLEPCPRRARESAFQHAWHGAPITPKAENLLQVSGSFCPHLE